MTWLVICHAPDLRPQIFLLHSFQVVRLPSKWLAFSSLPPSEFQVLPVQTKPVPQTHFPQGPFTGPVDTYKFENTPSGLPKLRMLRARCSGPRSCLRGANQCVGITQGEPVSVSTNPKDYACSNEDAISKHPSTTATFVSICVLRLIEALQSGTWSLVHCSNKLLQRSNYRPY